MTTSPPCLHEVAWWPRGSSTAPGQKGQEEAVDVLRPSHHLMATWYSSESKCMFRLTEGMVIFIHNYKLAFVNIMYIITIGIK